MHNIPQFGDVHLAAIAYFSTITARKIQKKREEPLSLMIYFCYFHKLFYLFNHVVLVFGRKFGKKADHSPELIVRLLYEHVSPSASEPYLTYPERK